MVVYISVEECFGERMGRGERAKVFSGRTVEELSPITWGGEYCSEYPRSVLEPW